MCRLRGVREFTGGSVFARQSTYTFNTHQCAPRSSVNSLVSPRVRVRKGVKERKYAGEMKMQREAASAAKTAAAITAFDLGNTFFFYSGGRRGGGYKPEMLIAGSQGR